MTRVLDEQSVRLGRQIRLLRRAQGLTLVQLAERTHLTHSFLSQLERGLTRPSMPSLDRIARALDSTQPALMAAAEPDPVLTPGCEPRILRADEGPAVPAAGGHARMLVPHDSVFHPMEYVGTDTTVGTYFAHPEDEFLYVATGFVTVELQNQGCHHLSPGDSLYYRGGTPHRWWASATDAPGYRLLVVKQRIHDEH